MTSRRESSGEASPVEPPGEGDLSIEVAAMARRLDVLAQEVRSRSVVVVDDDGFERMSITTRGQHGVVTLRARPSAGPALAVELYATDGHPADGLPARVGLDLVEDGNTVGYVFLEPQGEPVIGSDPDARPTDGRGAGDRRP